MTSQLKASAMREIALVPCVRKSPRRRAAARLACGKMLMTQKCERSGDNPHQKPLKALIMRIRAFAEARRLERQAPDVSRLSSPQGMVTAKCDVGEITQAIETELRWNRRGIRMVWRVKWRGETPKRAAAPARHPRVQSAILAKAGHFNRAPALPRSAAAIASWLARSATLRAPSTAGRAEYRLI